MGAFRSLFVFGALAQAACACAWADLAAVEAGIRRVQEKCLTDAAVERGELTPRFGRLDSEGFNDPADSLFMDFVGATLPQGTPSGPPGDDYRRRYSALRAEIAQYAKARGFDDFQRACLAKCAANQYYQDTTHGWQRFTGGFDDAVGDCVQSTAMAVDITRGLGVHAEAGHTAALMTFTHGATHAFPIITLDGREFVMNANWPEPCTFRFSESWESHRTFDGEFRPLHHVNYTEAYETAFRRQEARRLAREALERRRAEVAPDPAPRPGSRTPF